MQTKFENTPGNYNIFGNLTTEKWAREALPKLVPLAHEQKTINYKEMAESWCNVKAYRLMGRVCGIISTTLYELERRSDWQFGEIPRLPNIVTRTNGEPGRWICEMITGDRKIAPPREFYHKYHLLPTFEYPYWYEVLKALDLPVPNGVEQQLRESNLVNWDQKQINWDPQQLLSDFFAAAEHGQIEIPSETISIEQQPKPHTPPKELSEEKMAVYVFSTDTEVLKVGKANTGSENRYLYQHYNPDAAGSTLAKSLMQDENIPSMLRPVKESVSDMIMERTDRVNFLLDVELGLFVLNLFEAYIQCRLRPIYEGFKSQR